MMTKKKAHYIRLVVVLTLLILGLYKLEVWQNLPNIAVFSPEDLEGTKLIEQLHKSQYTRTEHADHKFGYNKIEYTNTVNTARDPNAPSILMLSIVANPKSYGKDQTHVEFLKKFETLANPKNHYSLGILVSDAQEFTKFNEYLLENAVKYVDKITLIQAPFIDETNRLDRTNRHATSAQRARRRLIARVRNFLLFNVLKDEQYTIFFDSDIVEFKQLNMIDLFIETDLDIVVPRIMWGAVNIDYDRNSWRGERTKPGAEELRKMDANDWDNVQYVPEDVLDKIYHFYTFVALEQEAHQDISYAFPLDSVGGAVLFAKSIIYKQGVVFPTSYIVGTTWDRDEGYDGIETEGICYLAKPLGYTCWGMPNIVAVHSAD